MLHVSPSASPHAKANQEVVTNQIVTLRVLNTDLIIILSSNDEDSRSRYRRFKIFSIQNLLENFPINIFPQKILNNTKVLFSREYSKKVSNTFHTCFSAFSFSRTGFHTGAACHREIFPSLVY